MRHESTLNGCFRAGRWTTASDHPSRVLSRHAQSDQHTGRHCRGAADTGATMQDQAVATPKTFDHGSDPRSRCGERACREIRNRKPHCSVSIVVPEPIQVLGVFASEIDGLVETDDCSGVVSALQDRLWVGSRDALAAQPERPSALRGQRYLVEPAIERSICGRSHAT